MRVFYIDSLDASGQGEDTYVSSVERFSRKGLHKVMLRLVDCSQAVHRVNSRREPCELSAFIPETVCKHAKQDSTVHVICL